VETQVKEFLNSSYGLANRTINPQNYRTGQ